MHTHIYTNTHAESKPPTNQSNNQTNYLTAFFAIDIFFSHSITFRLGFFIFMSDRLHMLSLSFKANGHTGKENDIFVFVFSKNPIQIILAVSVPE